jgi:hypothetical protein
VVSCVVFKLHAMESSSKKEVYKQNEFKVVLQCGTAVRRFYDAVG